MVTEIRQARSHGEDRSFLTLLARIFRFGLRRKKARERWLQLKTLFVPVGKWNDYHDIIDWEWYSDSSVVYTRCGSRNYRRVTITQIPRWRKLFLFIIVLPSFFNYELWFFVKQFQSEERCKYLTSSFRHTSLKWKKNSCPEHDIYIIVIYIFLSKAFLAQIFIFCLAPIDEFQIIQTYR